MQTISSRLTLLFLLATYGCESSKDSVTSDGGVDTSDTNSDDTATDEAIDERDASTGVDDTSDTEPNDTSDTESDDPATDESDTSDIERGDASTGEDDPSDTEPGEPSPDAGEHPTGGRALGPHGEGSLVLGGFELDCGNTCELVVAGAYELPDDKILGVTALTTMRLSQAVSEWHIFRLNADATALDPSFGTEGILVVNGGNPGSADPGNFSSGAHGLDDAGRLVLLNHPRVAGTPVAPTVTRYAIDGTLDPDFGVEFSPPLTSTHNYTTLVPLAGGGVLVGGSISVDGSLRGPRDWMLTLLDDDGRISEANPEEGFVRISPPDATEDGLLQKLFVIGEHVYVVGRTTKDQTVLARLALATLELDVTFGENGFVSVIDEPDSSVNDLTLDSDGRVLVAGAGPGQAENVWNARSGKAFHVRRYSAAGSPDESFGDAGLVVIDFGQNSLRTQIFDDVATRLRVLPDGRIFVQGQTSSQTGSPPERRISMTRLLTDGTLDESFVFVTNRLSLQQQGLRIHLRASDMNWPLTAVVERRNGTLLGISSKSLVSNTGTYQPIIDATAPILLQWWE